MKIIRVSKSTTYYVETDNPDFPDIGLMRLELIGRMLWEIVGNQFMVKKENSKEFFLII